MNNAVADIAATVPPRAPSREARRQPQHRCRLYRLTPASWSERNHLAFTEVWDTVDHPHEELGVLPDGEVVALEQDISAERVRMQMDARWELLRVVTAGSWRNRGVI